MQIEKELHNDFLVYASDVNLNRALPDVRDGLKPSQRAIIWEMFDKGYSSSKPHVKCAKVDGGIIAHWIPHGSEYSTIVRMSQPWLNNIPEVDFHGANGSVLGGPDAAASRYTECRLSKASEDGLLKGLDKETVPMILNFSEDLKWPSVLPSILPRLFVNGSQGIGFCMAQEWEPGNLEEFYNKVDQYIKTGDITYDDIYPDYPSGGIIVNKKDIHTIYETGKGTVILRGKAYIEDDIIKIVSLPYQVYAEPFIQKIKDLVNSETITTIQDIYNKSDDNGMLIEIECDNPEATLERLYKLTDLQVSFSANQMAVYNGKTQMFNLKNYIQAYLNHNIMCLVNEYKYDLDKATGRLEIVQGYVVAIKNIDKVINIVKESEDTSEAQSALMSALNVTENQAKAITSLAIGKLTHMDSNKFTSEIEDLNKIIEVCNKTIHSDKAQKSEFMSRLKQFVAKFGWERHTEVIDVDIVKEHKQATKSVKSEAQFIIAFTANRNIKRIPIADFRSQAKIKNKGDEITHYVRVGLHDKFILISSSGLLYRMQANQIPLGSMNSSGTPVGIDDIIGIFDQKCTKEFIVFITNNKLIKKMNISDITNISKKSGTVVMKLDNDYITDIFVTDDEIIINNKSYNISKYLPKGRGAGGVKFKELQKVSK